MSVGLAGVSESSLTRWLSQLRRRLFIVVLNSSVLILVYSSMLVILLWQCMPKTFLRCLLWKVLTVFSSLLVQFAVVKEYTLNMCIAHSDFDCVSDFSTVKKSMCFESMYSNNLSAVDVCFCV